MSITILTPEDWRRWRDVRLEALQADPVAFTGSPEQKGARSEADWCNELTKNTIFVWRDADGTIGGTLGFYALPNPKVSHRGHLWGMYVRDNYRRRGIASQLMEAAIAHARSHVQQLHLAVDSEYEGAKALYEKFGFIQYGHDPRSLKVGEHYYDEHLMVKML